MQRRQLIFKLPSGVLNGWQPNTNQTAITEPLRTVGLLAVIKHRCVILVICLLIENQAIKPVIIYHRFTVTVHQR